MRNADEWERWLHLKPEARLDPAEAVRDANAARKETGERVRWRISWGQLAGLLILAALVALVVYFLFFHWHYTPPPIGPNSP
jgi:hypothetical protein